MQTRAGTKGGIWSNPSEKVTVKHTFRIFDKYIEKFWKFLVVFQHLSMNGMGWIISVQGLENSRKNDYRVFNNECPALFAYISG